MNSVLARPLLETLLIASFLTIILALVWARFAVFKTSDRRSLLSSRLYDPVVGLVIIVTCTNYYQADFNAWAPKGLVLALYANSASLFYWALRTTTKLKFALSASTVDLITQGAFSVSRHPFYTSYLLTWLGSALLYNSPVLWASTIYLAAFYYLSARQEEGALVQGKNGDDYRLYQRRVGMFLPRIPR